MTLDELIQELKGIRDEYPEFGDGHVEIDCGNASGNVTGVVAEELESAKEVFRYLTIRATEGGCCLLRSVWKAVRESRRQGDR
jgi:hypothetical protein